MSFDVVEMSDRITSDNGIRTGGEVISRISGSRQTFGAFKTNSAESDEMSARRETAECDVGWIDMPLVCIGPDDPDRTEGILLRRGINIGCRTLRS